MKKNTKTKFGKQLIKYSALSMALVSVADASGQIVFTDIDPDFTSGVGESFAIDFDGNGTNDITIFQDELTFVNNGNPITAPRIRIDTEAIAFENNGYTYTSNLPQGESISPNGDFIANVDLCLGYGYAYSFCHENQQESGDSLVGIRFDIEGSTHYGWIEFGNVTGNQYEVLSYAYESTPDMGIFAGNTSNDTDGNLSLEDNVIEGLSSYIANDALTITSRNPLQNVTIHNLNGQEVISQNLGNTSETINLNGLSTGVYIATVRTAGKSTAIKFVK